MFSNQNQNSDIASQISSYFMVVDNSYYTTFENLVYLEKVQNGNLVTMIDKMISDI